METLPTLTAMARASISSALAKHGVDIPKHAMQMAPMIANDMVSIGTPFHYSELETAFQHGIDLLEASNGAAMEKDIFDQLELTVDDFSNNYVVKSIADLVCTDSSPRSQVGQLLSYVMFMIHICIRQVKAGRKVDEEYVDMMLSSLSHINPIKDWNKVCAYIIYIHMHSA